MKNKKRDLGARFWSGTRRHSAIGLLETFFQFNDPAIVKEALSTMVQYSVQKNNNITGHPEEIFHLHQSLRSLVWACCLIAGKAGKGRFRASEENHTSMSLSSLSAEEYQHPVKVFRKAFKNCSPEEFDNFLSVAVYFSLGNLRCEEERKLIIPYFQLIKMLDAAWLIVERASSGK